MVAGSADWNRAVRLQPAQHCIGERRRVQPGVQGNVGQRGRHRRSPIQQLGQLGPTHQPTVFGVVSGQAVEDNINRSLKHNHKRDVMKGPLDQRAFNHRGGGADNQRLFNRQGSEQNGPLDLVQTIHAVFSCDPAAAFTVKPTDIGIGVPVQALKTIRQQYSKGGLADPHRPDDNHMASVHRPDSRPTLVRQLRSFRRRRTRSGR